MFTAGVGIGSPMGGSKSAESLTQIVRNNFSNGGVSVLDSSLMMLKTPNSPITDSLSKDIPFVRRMENQMK